MRVNQIVQLQYLLLVFLSLLQFIAPLVHAHSRQDFQQFNLHIPTLEIYNRLTADSPRLQNNESLTPTHETIIGISTGIKNNPINHTQPLSDYFPPPDFIFTLTLITAFINFSPPRRLQAKKFVFSLASPRAPPFFLS